MARPLPVVLKQFSIKRYEPCADWTAEEWLKALSARAALRLKIFDQKDRAAKEARQSELIRQDSPLGNSLLQVAEARLIDPLRDLSLHQAIPHVPRSLAVRDFVASDLYFVNRSMGELNWQTCPDLVLRSLPDADPANNPIFFAVNLCHPDALIAEEFSLWLQKARARSGVKPTKASETYLTEDHLATWHQRHLLAYLDIAFWARLNGIQLGNARIGELLYPQLSDVEKRMETSAKQALRLISRQNLEALTQLVMRRRALA